MTGIETALLTAVGDALKRWGKADARDMAQWRGSATFTQVDSEKCKILGIPYAETGFYDVELSESDPLRLYSNTTKHEYRTRMVLRHSDLGSIPPAFRKVGGEYLNFDPAAFKKTYGLHDGVYLDGGVWVRDPANPKSDWVFVECERVFSDILLLWGLSAEGANNVTLQAVYRSVRIGADKAWENHRNR